MTYLMATGAKAHHFVDCPKKLPSHLSRTWSPISWFSFSLVSIWTSVAFILPFSGCAYALPFKSSEGELVKDNVDEWSFTLGNSALFIVVIVVASISLVLVIFNCLCCQHQGFKNAFKPRTGLPFRGSRSTSFASQNPNSEFTMFPPDGAMATMQPRDNDFNDVTFDPLPNIHSKSRASDNVSQYLRPASFGNVISRGINVKDWFDAPHVNFPRSQLKYLSEMGSGWFGHVVEGDAVGIIPTRKHSRVVVKILREDATRSDQMFFLQEVKPYRDLSHPHILALLGQCLETDPFLIILEYCAMSDLKSYLIKNRSNSELLFGRNFFLNTAQQLSSALCYMHQHGFIHLDLAIRNCLLTEEFRVKLGDYGTSIEHFKDDYYCLGDVALPLRWCAPESLICTDTIIEAKEVTREANVWSFGILMWELLEFGKMPYFELSNDDVLQKVIIENKVTIEKPKTPSIHKNQMFQVMQSCWNRSPNMRPSMHKISALLKYLCENLNLSENESLEFEKKWSSFDPSLSRDHSLPAEAVHLKDTSLKFENNFDPSFQDKESVKASREIDLTHDLSIGRFESEEFVPNIVSPSLQNLRGSLEDVCDQSTPPLEESRDHESEVNNTDIIVERIPPEGSSSNESSTQNGFDSLESWKAEDTITAEEKTKRVTDFLKLTVIDSDASDPDSLQYDSNNHRNNEATLNSGDFMHEILNENVNTEICKPSTSTQGDGMNSNLTNISTNSDMSVDVTKITNLGNSFSPSPIITSSSRDENEHQDFESSRFSLNEPPRKENFISENILPKMSFTKTSTPSSSPVKSVIYDEDDKQSHKEHFETALSSNLPSLYATANETMNFPDTSSSLSEGSLMEAQNIIADSFVFLDKSDYEDICSIGSENSDQKSNREFPELLKYPPPEEVIAKEEWVCGLEEENEAHYTNSENSYKGPRLIPREFPKIVEYPAPEEVIAKKEWLCGSEEGSGSIISKDSSIRAPRLIPREFPEVIEYPAPEEVIAKEEWVCGIEESDDSNKRMIPREFPEIIKYPAPEEIIAEEEWVCGNKESDEDEKSNRNFGEFPDMGKLISLVKNFNEERQPEKIISDSDSTKDMTPSHLKLDADDILMMDSYFTKDTKNLDADALNYPSAADQSGIDGVECAFVVEEKGQTNKLQGDGILEPTVRDNFEGPGKESSKFEDLEFLDLMQENVFSNPSVDQSPGSKTSGNVEINTNKEKKKERLIPNEPIEIISYEPPEEITAKRDWVCGASDLSSENKSVDLTAEDILSMDELFSTSKRNDKDDIFTIDSDRSTNGTEAGDMNLNYPIPMDALCKYSPAPEENFMKDEWLCGEMNSDKKEDIEKDTKTISSPLKSSIGKKSLNIQNNNIPLKKDELTENAFQKPICQETNSEGHSIHPKISPDTGINISPNSLASNSSSLDLLASVKKDLLNDSLNQDFSSSDKDFWCKDYEDAAVEYNKKHIVNDIESGKVSKVVEYPRHHALLDNNDVLIVDTRTNEALMVDKISLDTFGSIMKESDAKHDARDSGPAQCELDYSDTSSGSVDASEEFVSLTPSNEVKKQHRPVHSFDDMLLTKPAMDGGSDELNSSGLSSPLSFAQAAIPEAEEIDSDAEQISSNEKHVDMYESYTDLSLINFEIDDSDLEGDTSDSKSIDREIMYTPDFEDESECSDESSSTSGSFKFSTTDDLSDENGVEEDISHHQVYINYPRSSLMMEDIPEEDEDCSDEITSSWDAAASPLRSSLKSPDRKQNEVAKNVRFEETNNLVHSYSPIPESNDVNLSGGARNVPNVDYTNFADWDIDEDEDIPEVIEIENDDDETSYPNFGTKAPVRISPLRTSTAALYCISVDMDVTDDGDVDSKDL